MSSGTDPRATVTAAMIGFRHLPRTERYGRISLWTMYYFGALIVPAITTAVRTGHIPQTAIDALDCTVDDEGHVVDFMPRQAALTRYAAGAFDDLVSRHLKIMIGDCARLAGFPARVAWSNAAVMIEHAVKEAGRDADCCEETRRAVIALTADGSHPMLKRPFRAGAHQLRRVCCLRYLNPACGICPDICPRGVHA